MAQPPLDSMPQTLTDMANGLRGGRPALLHYLDVLEEHFHAREPEVQAFLPEAGRFERLRQEARALLALHPAPHFRPPLFGVPIGVKDIFHVEGFTTRAGSVLPPEELMGAEAAAVSRLKGAGALILGKTVTTEFAYFAPGPTRNPHNPEHTPGGSSSGSAAAVAAGLSLLTLGTQTIGSINRPAAFCGVVGYKPSYERISRAGVIPLSPTMDHVGLFTPTAAGARLAASLLVAGWREEAGQEAAARRPVLAVPTGPYLRYASPRALDHFEATVARIEAAGYRVRRVPAMAEFEKLRERHDQVVAGEAAGVHAGWFTGHAPLYHTRTAELIRQGQGIDEETLAAAISGRRAWRQALMQLMDDHELDLWLSPAAPGAAPRGLESTGDPVMNLPWTHAGLPTLTLPSGRDPAGLPLALQLCGRWHADEQMLAWAPTLEAILTYAN